MKKTTCLLLLILTVHVSKAQTNPTHEKYFSLIAKSLNAQKTANSKDILTTLFRASLDSLLGKNHSFTFNSSFYGIDSIFRGAKAKKLSYEDERKLRRNSLNISLTGDSSNNITKIAGGLTFTILNKKDIVYTKFEDEDDALLLRKELLVANIKKGINKIFTSKHTDLGEDLEVNTRMDLSWNNADKKNDFSNLDPYILEALRASEFVDSVTILDKSFTKEEIQEAIKSILLGKNPLNETFNAIAEKYSRKPLWTFTPTAIYDKVNDQGEFSFASEFTVGLGKNLDRKPWELEIKSLFKIANDTSVKTTNYDNKPFSLSIGLNKVVIETDDNEPKMEFKLFTQYDYQFGKLSAGAKPGLFTLNSTFRVKVFKSLWLPVTLKYDPENNNFLGLFSITANLGD
ncbi:MAG: hypothetical protein JNL69_00795 [Bacteroidia bacterium]|nr:hypothetical protein [Bacteroidia bacterium]